VRAIDLANARLKANPKDLQAKFDAGAAYGLQASYVASVEGSVMSAFGIAKNAYNAQEEVMDRDPSRVAAGLVVGTYRYLISTLNLPTRVVAYIAGFGGGKEKGIKLLEGAAKDPETRVDAQFALMLIYSREGRHNDVVRIAHQLSTEFPRNRLLVLEEGAAAIRAGRAVEADAALTRGLDGLQRDTRPRVPGEGGALAVQARARAPESEPAACGRSRSQRRDGRPADELDPRTDPRRVGQARGPGRKARRRDIQLPHRQVDLRGER
jgi:hypothetical protein